MSQKYGNSCATYTIPLNIDENEILLKGSAHLQDFINLNVKMEDSKPTMLKMHLEIDDSPSVGEIEERNIEHNISSIKGLRQSVQQLEEEMKALKDALQQAMEDVVNQLKLNRIDSSPNVDNNATQESNSNKQPNNENKLSGEHNDTDSIASTSEGHHTTIMPKEKSEVIDLRENCVYVKEVKGSNSSIEEAFRNIHKLANEMKVEIPYDSVIYIDVHQYSNYLDYYVYFCNAVIKKEFLKNRHILKYNPKTNPVRIFDFSNWGILRIRNVKSSDLSLDAAYERVIRIANKMGITNEWNEVRNSIDHIDVVRTKPNFLTYSVRFKDESMRKNFLQSKYLLKQFPGTKSLEISDKGGHNFGFIDIEDLGMTVVGANVIGIAELIGLSLTTDNIKRIYVLNYSCYGKDHFSINVEFSSKQVKDEFLEKKDKLKEIEKFTYDDVEISDINAEKNVVSIKYLWRNDATTLSFIGLAKQLSYPFTPHKVKHFINLSILIDNVYYSR